MHRQWRHRPAPQVCAVGRRLERWLDAETRWASIWHGGAASTWIHAVRGRGDREAGRRIAPPPAASALLTSGPAQRCDARSSRGLRRGRLDEVLYDARSLRDDCLRGNLQEGVDEGSSPRKYIATHSEGQRALPTCNAAVGSFRLSVLLSCPVLRSPGSGDSVVSGLSDIAPNPVWQEMRSFNSNGDPRAPS